jgi:hypothetical protein
MDFNYNLIAQYNLCWEDLVIVYLVNVSNNDVQHNVKHKLDFDDCKIHFSKKIKLKCVVVDKNFI